MEIAVEKFRGCLLGLALGDALGAPFEGGPAERLLWKIIGRTRRGEMRWTDDTQMALDLAESLIAKKGLDPDDLAWRFASSYRWSRGYGPGAAKLLKRIAKGAPWREACRSVYRDGSFGNGGAMRAPVVGIYYCSSGDDLARGARESAMITHAHPLGIEGAVLVAAATAAAARSASAVEILDFAAEHCREPAFIERIEVASQWVRSGAAPSPNEVRLRLGNGIAAAESCVTATYVSARFIGQPLETLLDFVATCGGDVDTIGAMAGAIWGTANGSAQLPESCLKVLEDRARLEDVAEALFVASATRG